MVLAGTLTLPAYASADGGYPAVVLVSGSGQQDRDESLLDTDHFVPLRNILPVEASLLCVSMTAGWVAHRDRLPMPQPIALQTMQK